MSSSARRQLPPTSTTGSSVGPGGCHCAATPITLVLNHSGPGTRGPKYYSGGHHVRFHVDHPLIGDTATLLLASAYGSSTATTGAVTSPDGVLSVRTTSLGPVLFDAKMLTVYLHS